MEGFGDIVHGAGLESLDLDVEALVPAEEENGNVPKFFVRLEPLADFQAGHFGHVHVQ
jgi:hypothetical protein